jgi:hypothetical protein
LTFRFFPLLLAVSALASVGAGGCSGGSCGEACLPEFGLTVNPTSGMWTPGTYAFDMQLDGQPTQCTVAVAAFPSGMLPAGGVQGSCSETAVNLSLLQNVTCTTTQSGTGPYGAISMSCAPIAGQFHVQIGVLGTPAEVDLAVSRDGTTLAPPAAMHPSYTLTPDCAAGCLTANATVSISGT